MKQRQSNIELLRIISMLMIVTYHYVIHGYYELIGATHLAEKIYFDAISMFGKIGVNLFVLISAYFGIDRPFSKKNFVLTILHTDIFSWIALILAISCLGTLKFRAILAAVFPVVFNEYWYVTAWIVVYILSPWLNQFLVKLDRSEYRRLIMTLLVLWCVIPCFTYQSVNGMNWSQQIWMFVMYIVGGAIKRFNSCGLKVSLIGSDLSVALLLASVLIMNIVGVRFPVIQLNATYFRWSNSLLAVSTSIFIFLLFINLNIGYRKSINCLAAGAFSVYLFHENPFISEVLWMNLFSRILKNGNLEIYVLHSIISVLFIYVFGLLIHYTIWRPINRCLIKYIRMD